jgi:hypothetical protein
MNSYQFIHHESYSIYQRKNSNRRTAISILLESIREESSCSHITDPQKPIILYGENPFDLIQQLEWLGKAGIDKRGKKIRKDTQLLGASVASINFEPTVENLKKPEIKKWIDSVHEFFKSEFGDSYKSLVLHLDEGKIHVHGFHIAQLNTDNTVDCDAVHPGYKAQRAVNKNAGRTVKKTAYNHAMRTFQDRYYKQVGMSNGQIRFGPKRSRMTRSEWMSAKHHAELLAESINEYKNENISLRKKMKQLIDYTKNIFTNDKNKSRDNNYE